MPLFLLFVRGKRSPNPRGGKRKEKSTGIPPAPPPQESLTLADVGRPGLVRQVALVASELCRIDHLAVRGAGAVDGACAVLNGSAGGAGPSPVTLALGRSQLAVEACHTHMEEPEGS